MERRPDNVAFVERAAGAAGAVAGRAAVGAAGGRAGAAVFVNDGEGR